MPASKKKKGKTKGKKGKRNSLIDALLAVGFSKFLATQILSAMENEEDVLDMLARNPKRPGNTSVIVPSMPTTTPAQPIHIPIEAKPPEYNVPAPNQKKKPQLYDVDLNRSDRLNPLTEATRSHPELYQPRIGHPPEAPYPADHPYFTQYKEKYAGLDWHGQQLFFRPIIFRTMQDSRVDDLICLPMEGDVINFAEPERVRIPRDTHPNCRCRYVDAVTGQDLGQI